MNVIYTKTAEKQLKAMGVVLRAHMISEISNIPQGNIKKLHTKIPLYRLRIGRYRVIFALKGNDTIHVENIDLRKDVYKNL